MPGSGPPNKAILSNKQLNKITQKNLVCFKDSRERSTGRLSSLYVRIAKDICEHHFTTQNQASSYCVRLEFEILSDCQILMRFYILLTACAELGRMTLHWEVRRADKDLCVLFLPVYSVQYAIL